MKLSLRTERLAELSTDDLNRVAGAAVSTIAPQCLLSLRYCGPSWDACTTAMSCGCQPTWNCA